MSQEETPSDEPFERKLARLRMRIDLLAPEQRPHLVELAEAISREYRQLQDERVSHHGSE